MSGIRMEERDGSREVEGEEQAGRANPWQEIPLRDMPPPVEGAPQAAAAAEQQDNVPGDAGNPEGIPGQTPLENPAEAGNSPNQQNEGCEAAAAGQSTERKQEETCPKEMKLCLYVVMWALILYLTVGTVIFSASKSPAENGTTLVTDVNFNEITPMTTIFNVATTVDNSTINVPYMDI